MQSAPATMFCAAYGGVDIMSAANTASTPRSFSGLSAGSILSPAILCTQKRSRPEAASQVHR
jgi:hypothetical protein